jgi:hypothetical protein
MKKNCMNDQELSYYKNWSEKDFFTMIDVETVGEPQAFITDMDQIEH